MIRLTPEQYLAAMRVPLTLLPQRFGAWEIRRARVRTMAELLRVGWGDLTMLLRPEEHGDDGLVDERWPCQPTWECVMEDSRGELARHLPILLVARGRVLVSGLGLGCVVRGLLANAAVEHVDVVEIDPDILRVVGPEFTGMPRVTLHHGDALGIEWPEGTRWDYAWHDIWSPAGLQVLHTQLLMRYHDLVRHRQGAWGYPREAKRVLKRCNPQPALVG